MNMNIVVRKAADRGVANFGWLDSRHSFSFGDYYDPRHMGFRTLRVINDDRVAGGQGFGTHPHRDMEIISYVVDGALEHRDSMGTGSVIQAGDVQVMSAGRGVTHSEFNHDKETTVHFLQIWIVPAQRGVEPSYQQKSFPRTAKQDRLTLLVSGDGRDGSMKIHQDALLFASVLGAGKEVAYTPHPGRYVWVQVVTGGITLEGQSLSAGDGAAISAAQNLAIRSEAGGEFLLFDLA